MLLLHFALSNLSYSNSFFQLWLMLSSKYRGSLGSAKVPGDFVIVVLGCGLCLHIDRGLTSKSHEGCSSLQRLWV